MYKEIQFRLSSLTPLIMHNGDLANPMNPHTVAMKKITSKRSKTEADHKQLAHLEFIGSLYLDKEKGVVIPDHVMEATVHAGAKKFNEGKVFLSAAFIQHHSKLFFGNSNTPQEPEEMWEDGQFTYQAIVKVGQAKILRTRPKFDEWSLVFVLTYDDSQADEDQVIRWVQTAGDRCGLCDRRPKFGRFAVEILNGPV